MKHPLVGFFEAKCAVTGAKASVRWAVVSVEKQKLWVFGPEGGGKGVGECSSGYILIKEYACSTSAKPPSCQYGSLGTPLGLHRVAQKIGAGAPPGAVFEKRVATGKIATQKDPAAVTTRILWLEGLEEGKNKGYECGSHNRKIYIHGVNRPVGAPRSHGCVEMDEREVVELFDFLEEGDLVLID